MEDTASRSNLQHVLPWPVTMGRHVPPKQLKYFSPAYLQDSYELLKILNELGELPEGTRMFTMDATSMYTNIDTDYGMEVLEKFIDMFADELSPTFPIELLLFAIKLIMKLNVFEFGNDDLLKLDGTTMGNPSVCMYATVYYAFLRLQFC